MNDLNPAFRKTGIVGESPFDRKRDLVGKFR